MSDPHQLERFVQAQGGGVYERALAELTAGAKRSHWMWFVFPQIAGLGRSSTAVRYAIASRDEAVAYLAHPLLGPRLLACVDAILAAGTRDARAIFGEVDAVKLRSSLTLFAAVAPGETRFNAALNRFFGGEPDPATLSLLGLCSSG